MREVPSVYVAALAGRKEEAAATARRLEKLGLLVESTWHDNPTDPGLTIPEKAAEMAARDLSQVRMCDALLVLAQPLGSTFTGGGHCAEFGMALALGKQCLVLGDLSCIFYHHPDAARVESVDAAAAAVWRHRWVHREMGD